MRDCRRSVRVLPVSTPVRSRNLDAAFPLAAARLLEVDATTCIHPGCIRSTAVYISPRIELGKLGFLQARVVNYVPVIRQACIPGLTFIGGIAPFMYLWHVARRVGSVVGTTVSVYGRNLGLGTKPGRGKH